VLPVLALVLVVVPMPPAPPVVGDAWVLLLLEHAAARMPTLHANAARRVVRVKEESRLTSAPF
jgi:hypothetical protein